MGLFYFFNLMLEMQARCLMASRQEAVRTQLLQCFDGSVPRQSALAVGEDREFLMCILPITAL